MSGVFDALARPLVNRPGDAILRGPRQKTPSIRHPTPLDVEHIPNPWGLTAVEYEVMRLVVDGHTNVQIAEILCRSVKTIEAHLMKVRDRMNARSTTRAAVLFDRFARELEAREEMRQHKGMSEVVRLVNLLATHPERLPPTAS